MATVLKDYFNTLVQLDANQIFYLSGEPLNIENIGSTSTTNSPSGTESTSATNGTGSTSTTNSPPSTGSTSGTYSTESTSITSTGNTIAPNGQNSSVPAGQPRPGATDTPA